jgi:bifunctional non-homologous end joining protein LigD
MLAIDDITGLISLVQGGRRRNPPLGINRRSLDQPGRLIFDLDPGENVPWEVVVDAAHDVRDRLATLGIKTSGGKGLHLWRLCGNDHKTRNEAEAATPWGHSCEVESLT